jgi:hypothetical protein
MAGHEGAGYTQRRGGGEIDDRVKACRRVKEGGAFVGVAPWCEREAAEAAWCPRRGGVRGGGYGAVGSVREGGTGRGWPGGLARPAWPLGAKRLDGPAGHWADWAES